MGQVHRVLEARVGARGSLFLFLFVAALQWAGAATSNDLCDGATAISPAALPYTAVVDLADFTEPWAGDSTCGFYGSNDGFWSFSPAVSGRYRITFAFDNYQYAPVLKIFPGTCDFSSCIGGATPVSAGNYEYDWIAGETRTYVLEADATVAQQTSMTFSLLEAAPSNDVCSSPSLVAADTLPFQTTLDLNDYFLSDTTDDACGSAGSRDAFWSFTPPASGKYRFTLSYAPYQYDAYLKVLRGSCASIEACVFAQAVGTSPVDISLLGGESYVVVLEANPVAAQQTTLRIALQTLAPAGDLCSSAVAVDPAALPYQDTFDLQNYWIADGVDSPCNNSGDYDRFWTFSPTVSGRYRVNLDCGSCSYSSAFKVFRGECGDWICESVDGFSGPFQRDFLFEPGEPYVFVVEGPAPVAQETTFELSYVSPLAANDTCASATVIDQGMLPLDVTFDLANFPVNDTGDDKCGSWGANDGFWKFTPTIGGLYEFDLECSPYAYGVLFKIIKGGCDWATNVCEYNSGVTPTATFQYRLSAGTTYVFVADGTASFDQSTRFQMSLITPAPVNETCATAISIADSALPYTGTAVFEGATTYYAFWRFSPSATDIYATRLADDGSDNACFQPNDLGCEGVNVHTGYRCNGAYVFRGNQATNYYMAVSYQNDSSLDSRFRLEKATVPLPCGETVAGTLTAQDYPTDHGTRTDLYRWSLDNPATTGELRAAALTLTPGASGRHIAFYVGRLAEYPTHFTSAGTSDPLQPAILQNRFPEDEYFVAVITHDTSGDSPYTLDTQCGVDPYYIAESAYWRPRRDFGASSTESDFPLAGLSIAPAGRTVNTLTFNLRNIRGLVSGDLSDVQLLQDTNGNGLGDAGDTPVGGAPTVALDGVSGSLRFAAPFTTGDDLILVADFANLESGDELTLSADASTLDVPAGFAKAGGGVAERYVVQGGVGDSGGDIRRWALTYRSPGGRNAAARFSPDGSRIIVAYDSGSAWIFDRAENVPVLGLHDHYDSAIYAGFSADNKSAITVSGDGAVFRWDAQTGAAQSQFFSNLAVTGAIPSPDLSRLAVISLGKVQLLDVDARRVLWEFIPGGQFGQPTTANAVAFSPDGSRIAIGADDNRVYMVNAATGVQEYRRTGHTQPVTTVAFTGAGDQFISASTDATVQLWSTTGSTSPLRTISLQGQEALGATISPDGSRIALVTRAQLRVFNASTVPPLELYAVSYPNANQASSGASSAFTPDGQFVALSIRGVNDPGVYLFRTTDGAHVQSWGTSGAYAASGPQSRPRLTQDGRWLFVSATRARKLGDSFIHGQQVWGIPVGAPSLALRPVPSERPVFDISGLGSVFMDSDGRMFVFDGATFTGLGVAPGGSASIVVSPDGGRYLNGDRLFGIPSGTALANYALPDAERSAAFSPDGGLWGFIEGDNIITVRSDDPNATLYNLTKTSPYQASKILYHPDGVRVGYVQNAGDLNFRGVQFVDMDQDLPVGFYRFPSYSSITDAALSRDGTMLLIGGGNEVRLYDMSSGETLRWFYPRNSHLNEMSCQSVDFASSDTQIVIGWDWGYVEIYGRSQARSLDLSPDARTLAVGQSQRFAVKVLYSDGNSLDVTPMAGGAANPDLQAALEVIPSSAATVDGNLLTVGAGAPATFRVRAQYRTGGLTLVDESAITVGSSQPVSLAADPDGFGTNPGSFRDIGYTVTWTDGYQEDVTDSVVLSTLSTDEVEIVDTSVRMRAIANPGDYTVTGAFTASGATVTADTIVTLYGPQTNWKRLRVTPGGYANDLEFSPDGSQLAVAESSGAVVLYGVQPAPTSYDVLAILDAHRGQAIYAGFPGENLLATASDDGTVRLWSSADGYASPTQEYVHSAPITAAARRGGYLAFGDTEGGVGLLDLSTFTPVWVVQRHAGKVRSVALDDNVVLSGGDDARAFASSTINGAQLHSFTFISEPVLSVGFWNADVYFILSADRTLTQVRASDYEVLRRFEYDLPLTHAETIGNEVYVASTQPAGAFVYNQEGLLLRWLDLSPGGGVVSLALDPTQTLLLTGRKGSSSSFQFWEAGRGLFRGDLEHSFPLGAAFADSDGQRIYTQSAKRTALFDATGAVPTNRPLLETGYFLPYDFKGFDVSEASNLFATNFGTNSILVFNSATNLLYRTLQNPEVPTAWSISPAGDRMAVADSVIRLWDLATLSQLNQESRDVAAVDMFLTNEATPRTYYAGVTSSFLGLWNNSGLLENGTVLPAGTAFDVRVNPTGTRVVVFRYAPSGCATPIYLDFYDISVISSEPAYLGSRFLFAWPCWGSQPVPRAAFSHDGQLVLAGVGNYAVPAQLINLGDGTVLHEFHPPSAIQGEAGGVADVQFVDNDRAAMIAWNEGYAEVLRRLNVEVLALDVAAIGRLSSGKVGSGLEGARFKDRLPLPTDAEVIAKGRLAASNAAVVNAQPGDILQALSVAGFDDGSLVNVSASSGLVSSQPGWVSIAGSRVTVLATAPVGGVFTLYARYTDYDTTVNSNTVTVRILGGNAEPPVGWMVK